MILNFLGNFKDIGFLAARIIIGAMYTLVYGLPKLLGGVGKWAETGANMKYVGLDFLPVFWGFMAAVTEVFGGIFIVLGLFFRPTAILLIVTMIVAAASHLGEGHNLIQTGHAIDMLAVFILFLFAGPGRLSIDNKFIKS